MSMLFKKTEDSLALDYTRYELQSFENRVASTMFKHITDFNEWLPLRICTIVNSVA
ncbi:hypothetical protein GCM10023352_15420 [Rothia endophytica]|uniref:Uncharacterized protein n=1 Tax=Rothia endophytica TaxID=1324766 RepID=A0ABP9BKG6_9MICC